jgi:exodeoxyribonuclease VII small subunit
VWGTKLAWSIHNCDYGLLPFPGASETGRKLEFAIPSQSKSAEKAIEELSFEAALRELEAIVSRLEQGEVDLEDSIALYERGQALKSHCEKKLKSAEGRLEKIVLGAGGPEIGAPETV